MRFQNNIYDQNMTKLHDNFFNLKGIRVSYIFNVNFFQFDLRGLEMVRRGGGGGGGVVLF